MVVVRNNHHVHKRRKMNESELLREVDMTPYAHPYMSEPIPDNEFPQQAIPPRVAKRLVQDELYLDSNPRMNLATFVTTYMEPEAQEMMIEGMRVNYIDMDEYPATTTMNNRCVNMLANLYHAPVKEGEDATGTSCVGSSEAIMLAGLAMKWKWREFRKNQKKSTEKPNIVFGSNVQVVWHKFCRYFDVEGREAPCSNDCLVLTAEGAKPLIDENTIGVVGILGSTYNGEYEDIKAIHDMVVKMNEEKGWQIPVHVDAASGGFIAPFIDPDLEWDFRLPNVKSINVSGHKFGLVYAGIGWAMWREKQDLPEDLIFHVNYLGGDQASFTLNFSKSASPVIGQYYQFLRLGYEGYKDVMTNGMKIADHFREDIRSCGLFDIVDKGHMPLVCFTLKPECEFTVFELQQQLERRGWTVPAYPAPPGADDLKIMRVVVKQNFTHDLADTLFADILAACAFLQTKKELTRVDEVVKKPEADADLKTRTKENMRILRQTVKTMMSMFGRMEKSKKGGVNERVLERAEKSAVQMFDNDRLKSVNC